MKKNFKRRLTKPKLMSTVAFCLLLATVSFASAFNSQTSTASARTSLRSHGIGMYSSRARSSQSNRVSLRKLEGQGSVRTRLQFSDDTSLNTTVDSGWWRRLFTGSSRLQNRSTTTSSSYDRSASSGSEEQENVDAYLEFLDKRYRRLHEDDKKVEHRDSSASKNGKPFSAIDWLTTGGNNNTYVIPTSRDQHADALYVLGVAGLASQKLLQKHHLPTTETPELDMEKAVDLDQEIDANLMGIKVYEKLVKSFLVPIVRVIYWLQRQKQFFLKTIQRKLSESALKITGVLGTGLSRGPKSILYTMLGIVGGRENIMRTVAIGYAAVVIFRPLLQAVVAEGLAFDPLIQ